MVNSSLEVASDSAFIVTTNSSKNFSYHFEPTNYMHTRLYMYVRMLAMVNIDIILEASQKLTVVWGGSKHGKGHQFLRPYSTIFYLISDKKYAMYQ